MGGTTLAKDVVFRALRAGKDVVTANKALIADCLPEIETVVAEANAAQGAGAPRVQFGYEAAVCGGIPIIHTMNTDFVGDEVTRLRGIMNGCTNFMLTKMEAEGLSYADCLAEATALGYAEEDPTLDVGGFDARSKLAILVRLAFGVDVDETLISCTGIAGLETIDFEYARGQLDGTIDIFKAMGGAPPWSGQPSKTCGYNSSWAPCAWWCDQQSCDQCHPNNDGYAHMAPAVLKGLGL